MLVQASGWCCVCMFVCLYVLTTSLVRQFMGVARGGGGGLGERRPGVTRPGVMGYPGVTEDIVRHT